MATKNYNAWIKAARRAAKRTAGLAAPSKRKALERAQARVAKAQAAVGKANVRLGKAKLAEARAAMRAAGRELKAIEKSGNLTMIDARKAYRKMSDRLGRPLKGVDVAKHPRIFRESMARRKRQKKQKPPGGGGGGEIKIKRIESIDDFLLLHPLDLIGGEVEYVSQAEYRK